MKKTANKEPTKCRRLSKRPGISAAATFRNPCHANTQTAIIPACLTVSSLLQATVTSKP